MTTVEGASLGANTVRLKHDSRQIRRAKGEPVPPLPSTLVTSVERRVFSGTKTLTVYP